MKRSEINAIVRDAESFIAGFRFALPPFARWTPADWATKGPEAHEIAAHGLGWDVTDFGLGQYASKGLTLFTVRNGAAANLATCRGKTYAEKLLIVGVDQITPYHYHNTKTEDIINRGGGVLMLRLYQSTPDGAGLAETEITVSMDGVVYRLPAGAEVALRPGESITLPTGLWHSFWAAEDRVLVGEVSTVNDDHTDNVFYEPLGRFPSIEEDEPILYPLVGDYAAVYPAFRAAQGDAP
jgi:hypothetical protein